ncbi:MAG: hypothetical protein QOG75_4753, partial [Mycobacterium sp.]|nr:hypothetical protein [Mycobacterium sp.]
MSYDHYRSTTAVDNLSLARKEGWRDFVDADGRERP